MHSTGLAIETIYRRRADHLAAAETRLGFQERTVARLRLAVFVTAVVLLFAGWKSEQGSAWY